MLIYDQKLKIFYSNKINDSRYFAGFGTRSLGDARKIANIFNFFSKTNTSYKTLVLPEQIHSTNIALLKEKITETFKKIEEVDGLITVESKMILTVKTADCLQIIFADKKKGIIGISHQGWRGSRKRMVENMVKKMIEVGSRKEDILIAFGPSIGSCCYDITKDRYYLFLEEFNGYSDKIFTWRSGKCYLNLPLLNYLLLVNFGIPKENIDFFPFCTKCDHKRFFSFRRERNNNKKYGEMLSFILKLD